MSVPDETLKKVLIELQNRLFDSRRQLASTKATLTTKEVERRKAKLTKQQVEELPQTEVTYKAVGKTFFKADRNGLTKDIDARVEKLTKEIELLEKQKAYHERTVSDAEASMRDIIRR